MKRFLAPLSVLVLSAALFAYACGGGLTNGSPVTGGGTPIGGGSADAGGKPDAGDAGTDAGADAGCANPNFSVTASDQCFGGVGNGLGMVSTSGCSTTLSLNAVTCTGTAYKPDGGFVGMCNAPPSYPCTSPSLPGTLTCVRDDGGTCTIVVTCAAAGCSL